MVLFMILVVNHFLIMCDIFEWQRISAGFVFNSLFICVMQSRDEGLAGLTPATFLFLPQARTWISNVICRCLSLCPVISKGEWWFCLFCWYWWYYLPSLLELNFLFIMYICLILQRANYRPKISKRIKGAMYYQVYNILIYIPSLS